MAIFKVEVDKVAPNKNKLGTLLALLLRSRENVKYNLNPQSESLTTESENGGRVSTDPKISRPINIDDTSYESATSETKLISPTPSDLQVAGEMEKLSDLINDPRYSIYNGDTRRKSSLADKIGVSKVDSGTKGSQTTVEISRIQGNQNSGVKWKDGKITGGSAGSSELNSLIKEYYGRREQDTGLMSKIAGATGFNLGGKNIFLKNYRSQDPATKNFIKSFESSQAFALTFEGHKSLEGLSLGSNHLWDISMDNYYGVGGITYAPRVPNVTGKKISGSLGNFIPACSYSYSGYSTITQDLDLVNEGSVSIIKGTKADNELEIEFVEDQNFTWKRYFTNYLNCIVDRENNAVAPYQQSVLQVNIMSYSPTSKIFFMHQLLVIPTDFSYKVEGEESAGELTLSVRFSVVGDLDDFYRDLRN